MAEGCHSPTNRKSYGFRHEYWFHAEVKFPGSVAMNGVQKIFANGSGTKEDPYILSSIEDLKKFADTVTNTGITYKDQYLKVAEGTVFDLSAEQWNNCYGLRQ